MQKTYSKGFKSIIPYYDIALFLSSLFIIFKRCISSFSYIQSQRNLRQLGYNVFSSTFSSMMNNTKKRCHPHSGGTFIVFYNLCLVEAEKDLQATVDAREAHEGQRKQSCGKHHNGHALHPFRNLHQLQLFTHAGKYRQSNTETNGC